MNPIISPADGETYLFYGDVVFDPATSRFHAFMSSSTGVIAHLWSLDGLSGWTRTGSVLTPGGSGEWDASAVAVPCVWREPDGTWHMLYRGKQPSTPVRLDATGYATATAPEGPWTKHPANPVLTVGPPDAWDWDGAEVGPGGVIRWQGEFYAMYEAGTGVGRSSGVATAPAPEGPWTRAAAPVFTDGRFCGSYYVDGPWVYALVPHYTVGSNFTEFELYRSGSPLMNPVQYLGIVKSTGPEAWEALDLDTPVVLCDTVDRNSRGCLGGAWRMYYAGEDGDTGHVGVLVGTPRVD